jgi:hypothetical protein
MGESTNIQLRNPLDIVHAKIKAGIRSSNHVMALTGQPLKSKRPHFRRFYVKLLISHNLNYVESLIAGAGISSHFPS